jgi:hypothetical protein
MDESSGQTLAPPPPPEWLETLPPPPTGGPPKAPWYRRPRRWLLAIVAVAALIAGVVVVQAVTGDGSDGGEESNLPEPASGMATIGGAVTLNGEPVAGETVTLSQDEVEKATVDTAADGTFVFEDVEPGTYSLSVGIYREAPSSMTFPIDVDHPCSAEGFMVLNASVTNNTTGETGVIASASNAGGEGRDDAPLQVAEGDQKTQDVAFVCEDAPTP